MLRGKPPRQNNLAIAMADRDRSANQHGVPGIKRAWSQLGWQWVNRLYRYSLTFEKLRAARSILRASRRDLIHRPPSPMSCEFHQRVSLASQIAVYLYSLVSAGEATPEQKL